MSSFQLPIVVGAGLVGYWMVGALRRRTEQSRDRVVPAAPEPQTCVVVRWLGEGSQNVRPLPSVAQARNDLNRAQQSHPSGKRRLDYIPLKGA
jgi:hypothetical protein